jgi:hypothetical protein
VGKGEQKLVSMNDDEPTHPALVMIHLARASPKGGRVEKGVISGWLICRSPIH